MFSEWNDPYDIDHYYNDLDALMKDVKTSPSSSMYIGGVPVQRPARAATELKPEQPTGVVINAAPPIAPIIAPMVAPPVEPTVAPSNVATAGTKSSFEPKYTLAGTSMDGHPLGRQPSYDILRSGPPSKESFGSPFKFIAERFDWYHFMMFIAIVFCVVWVLHLRSHVNSANLTNQTLCMMLTALNRPQSG